MDVFTRMIRGWKLSQHLTQSLTLNPLEQVEIAPVFRRDQEREFRPGDRDKLNPCYFLINIFRVAVKSPAESV